MNIYLKVNLRRRVIREWYTDAQELRLQQPIHSL